MGKGCYLQDKLMMKKCPIYRVCFSAFAAVCVLFAAGVFAQPESTSVQLPGVRESVSVRLDARAIPYIDAKNDADLYFVQGYVTASDRLWQMDLLRRVAAGETAEIFGRLTIEEDKRWRRFGFKRIAEASLQHLSPELRSALESYSNGVNAYIRSLKAETTPVEFRILQYKPREWTPADSVIIGKILADALSSTYRQDLLRESLKGFDPAKLAELSDPVTPFDVVLFGTDKPAKKAAVSSISKTEASQFLALADEQDRLRENSLRLVGLFAEELAASNNWVVSGKRTADGKAMLANDPHLMAAAPGIWYLVHLSAPSVRAAGVTFPGVPGVVLGHNEEIAWGATNVGPDVQDLYIETFKDGKVTTPAGWETPVTRTEEIRFRANPLSPELKSETLSVTETRKGPVIIQNGEKNYSLRWTALDPRNNEFEAFYFLNRAKNWEQFKKALSNYGGATQNFIYADTKGNIGWYAAGKVPIRRTGDGAFPYDGASADGDWTGFIPFAELPHLYNPAEGYILTANQRIVGTNYKYQQMSRDAAPPWRARRIYDRLSSAKKLTMDEVNSVQQDAYNIPLAMFVKDIVRLNAASAENLELYKKWDGMMMPDSRAALLANAVRVCTADRIAAANKPVPAYMIRERILWHAVSNGSKLWLPADFANWETLLLACEKSAEESLTKQFGADRGKWTWGGMFVSRFPHPLAAAPLIGAQFATPSQGISGSGQTPNVGSSVSMRHIASPENWDATRLVIPLGQSGDPRSTHFKDQFEMWRDGSPAVLPFTSAAVNAATRSVVTFQPGVLEGIGATQAGRERRRE